MKPDDLKIALDDARARHQALVNLVLFTDQKAMAVFRIYVTIGVAAAVTAPAGFFRSDELLQFSRWSMSTSALMLAIGAYFCTKAMSRATINLPGRGAEFWLWAMDERVTIDKAVGAYLSELHQKQDVNRDLNEKTAAALHTAVQVGMWTPAAAVLAGLVALFA
jgi:hypothetical protein